MHLLCALLLGGCAVGAEAVVRKGAAYAVQEGDDDDKREHRIETLCAGRERKPELDEVEAQTGNSGRS